MATLPFRGGAIYRAVFPAARPELRDKSRRYARRHVDQAITPPQTA
ncbi:hypothetical protein L579_1509 [Pantoea sp. AS-PWVM4]|nr:hypothetical protein L579_1509 [Pantoea sp. AS-PWVM4]